MSMVFTRVLAEAVVAFVLARRGAAVRRGVHPTTRRRTIAWQPPRERRRPSLGVVACVACAGVLAACTGPPAEAESEAMGPDAEAVMEMRQALHDALNRDDVDAIMAGLTDDHVTLPPGEPVIGDLEALRRWHETRVAAVDYEGSLRSEELVMLGDWALDRWSAEINARSRADGSPVEDEAKGLWIWRRGSDGQWKLAQSIWNSDRPTAAPTSVSARAAADIEAINAVREGEPPAWAGKDVDAILALFTEDARLLPPNAPALVGHDEIRAWTGSFLEQFDAAAEYTGSTVELFGDVAVEHYIAEMSLAPRAGGERVTATVKGIHIYRRQPDGSWRIQYDVWNADGPPDGA